MKRRRGILHPQPNLHRLLQYFLPVPLPFGPMASSCASCPLSTSLTFAAVAAGGVALGYYMASHCAGAVDSGAAASGPVVKVADPKESRDTYEKQQLVNQYLEFHFAPPSESFALAREAGIDVTKAYDFPARLARVAERHSRPDRRSRALDLGCAVGRTTFELAHMFKECVGIDLSNGFITAANTLLRDGRLAFDGPGQGERVVPRVALIPTGIDVSRVSFSVGDALAVDPALGQFDVIIAANLLCRVPQPEKLLEALCTRVTVGGIIILASPYSWWAGATNPESWLGGTEAKGESADVVKNILRTKYGMELLTEEPMPFLIRDHPRRFQLGFSHLTVWRRL